jgi:hypothetical protein
VTTIRPGRFVAAPAPKAEAIVLAPTRTGALRPAAAGAVPSLEPVTVLVAPRPAAALLASLPAAERAVLLPAIRAAPRAEPAAVLVAPPAAAAAILAQAAAPAVEEELSTIDPAADAADEEEGERRRLSRRLLQAAPATEEIGVGRPGRIVSVQVPSPVAEAVAETLVSSEEGVDEQAADDEEGER